MHDLHPPHRHPEKSRPGRRFRALRRAFHDPGGINKRDFPGETALCCPGPSGLSGAAAQSRLKVIVPALAKAAGATEARKAADPMKRVGIVNARKAQAEEVILRIIISA
ncbi:MAG: TnpV protein [Clostridia bacterium]|nr:TnpV protein [Clostridia bacterium]